MSWTLPLTDVELSEEDVAAYLSVLESGWLTMGPRTREFEGAFAERFGAEHAVALSSGTASLHLALLAAGVGDGDEVLVPAMTFVGGAAAVRVYRDEQEEYDQETDFSIDRAEQARWSKKISAELKALRSFGDYR